MQILIPFFSNTIAQDVWSSTGKEVPHRLKIGPKDRYLQSVVALEVHSKGIPSWILDKTVYNGWILYCRASRYIQYHAYDAPRLWSTTYEVESTSQCRRYNPLIPNKLYNRYGTESNVDIQYGVAGDAMKRCCIVLGSNLGSLNYKEKAPTLSGRPILSSQVWLRYSDTKVWYRRIGYPIVWVLKGTVTPDCKSVLIKH